MPDIKQKLGTSGDVFVTALDSLADGARFQSGSISDFATGFILDFMLKVSYTSSTPAVGATVAELYLLPAIDGSNFPENGSVVSQQALLIAQFESRNPSTTNYEYLAAMGVWVPAGTYRFSIRNTSGRAYRSTGNALSYRSVLQQY